MDPRERERQQKEQAWVDVESLLQRALNILVDVDEDPVEQAKLMLMVEKAVVKQKLWKSLDKQ